VTSCVQRTSNLSSDATKEEKKMRKLYGIITKKKKKKEERRSTEAGAPKRQVNAQDEKMIFAFCVGIESPTML
jgi:hypothetical protein